MRITRDILLKQARDFTEKRLKPDRNVTAVFLVGSLRPEDAPIPSALDIDLLVIYNGEAPREREIVKLSNEIHLDVKYENARHYAQPRELRGDPWRGWDMWDPLLLHETGRFFEYTQASLRAQFDDPENLLKRCRAFAAPARDFWNDTLFNPQEARPTRLLEATFQTANALAGLGGSPLSRRRMVSQFASRASLLGKPGTTASLLQSLTANPDPQLTRRFLPAWKEGLTQAAQQTRNPLLHPARLAYYQTALEEELNGNIPAAAQWILLDTWSLAAEENSLPPDSAAAWQTLCAETGMNPENLPARLSALDSFLDQVEEALEERAVQNGL